MERLERWFGAEERWERVATSADRRQDVHWAVFAFVVAAIGLEFIRMGGGLADETFGMGAQYVAVVSGAVLVAFRRIAPLTVMLLAAAHFIVAGELMPVVMASLPMQLLAFFLFFSGIAWARDRRGAVLATLAVLLVMALWLAWWLALGSGYTQIAENLAEEGIERYGFLSPVMALILYTILVNIIYFGFAIALGLVSWRGALERHRSAERHRTIQAQNFRLRDQAVVAERLRIARELHDVVAHHVSVMGVQAAAARRVLDRDPDAARESLAAIEQSSRSAVGQMRDLLGTLRSGEREAGSADADEGLRSPQPTLFDLATLAAEASTPTCTVTVELVESEPGAGAHVPAPVQLSAYRVVQEALANVRRHSTARNASAVVRVDLQAQQVEVEVVDDGTPRVGTSGSGLGLLGMRERAQYLGGGVESGPRTGRHGWRVRVWFPLDGRAVESGQTLVPTRA
ncbi:sensor histidine kinase [Ornithinimicrobium pratense]|uniref:histidine kinase n=1 Tax=Ornithinimicrobium pratense TaxID=2593973 RepID=A0A5J6V176_9MICO|nr:histidine kinase [Ornithinimicrobium pratense]QFG67470.1 sensor histidine kinase [Ornithinimicrobium pratense]